MTGASFPSATWRTFWSYGSHIRQQRAVKAKLMLASCAECKGLEMPGPNFWLFVIGPAGSPYRARIVNA